MNEELKIIISAEIKELKEALKEARGEIDETAESSNKLSGLGDGLKKVGGAAGKMAVTALAAAATGAAALSKAAIDSYAEYEQLIGGVETLFKDSAGIVEGYANEAFRTAGMSANEYMTTVTSFSASLLQSLDGDTKAAAEAANQAVIDMSDNANKMGTSIESIQNAYQGFAKQNYTMLDNLKLGYGGTKEEMERLLADAEKISGIKYDISNLNDVYSAIHTIQTELGITGTTAKEASSTIQGSAAAMKASWANLLTAMADENADFDAVLTGFIESVGAFAENLIPRIEVALDGIVKLIGGLAPKIVEFLPQLVNTVLPGLVDAVMNIIDGVAAVLPSLIDVILSVIPKLLEAIIAALPAVLDALAQAISSIAAALPQLIEILLGAIPSLITILLDAVITLVVSLLGHIGEIITPLIEAIPKLLLAIVEAVLSNLPVLLEGVLNLVLGIVAALPGLIQVILEALPTIITGLIDGIMNFLPKLIQGVMDLVLGIVEALPLLLAVIIECIPEIIKSVIFGLMNALPQILDGLIGLIVGIVDALPDLIVAIVDAIPQLIGALLIAIYECLPQILAALIKLVASLVVAIPEILYSLYLAIIKIFEGLWNTIIGIFKGIPGFYKEVFTKAWASTKQAFSGFGEYFSGLWNRLTAVFGKVGSYFKEKFKEGFNNIKTVFSGITTFFSGIWDKIKNIFTKVGTSISDAISGSVKGAINSVLGMAGKVINNFIGAINSAIEFINVIPNVNIKKLSKLSIPKLAEGGVVESATLAVVGERGKEAVMPLENNLEWLDKLADMLNDRMGGGSPIILQVDGKTFAQISVDSINQLTRQTGKMPLKLV